jgi:ferritin-like metal-binding protein YciE
MIDATRDLFALRLRAMLWVEKALVEELPLLAERVRAVDLRAAIERHLLETRNHVRTLERLVDGPPEESGALLGLKAELDLLQAVAGSEDLAVTAALAQIEHLELAAYAWLIATANALGEEEIAVQLQEILEQEEFALELVEQTTVKLLAASVG